MFEMYKADHGSESYYLYIGKAFSVVTQQHYHWYAATQFALPGVDELNRPVSTSPVI